MTSFSTVLKEKEASPKENRSPSNSHSSCYEDADKDAELDGQVYDLDGHNMMCDVDENEIMSDGDIVDDDSSTGNNGVVPTMFCKPVLVEGVQPSSFSHENSYLEFNANSDEAEPHSRRLSAESSNPDHTDSGN